MSPPRVADDQPLASDLVAVLDESSPANAAGGVAYVVTTAAVFHPGDVKLELGAMFPPQRKRPFHWAKEGVEARQRMVEIVQASGIVAVSYYAHVGRRQQNTTRRAMLTRAADWVAGEGAGHLIIEASDKATIGRDQSTLLDGFRDRGGVPFVYDWRSKNESLLWIADALAGATGEYVVGTATHWYDMLSTSGVLTLMQHP